MCFVLEWKEKFFARWIALCLALYNGWSSYFWPNSSRKHCNQILSLLVYLAATYSTLVVESALTFYNLEIQLTTVPPIVKTYPVVLLLVSTSPTRSKSTKPLRAELDLVKHNAFVVVPFKYHSIHLTTLQCSILGLLIYLLTTPTTWAISSHVHTIAYIRLPTTDEYEMLDILSTSSYGFGHISLVNLKWLAKCVLTAFASYILYIFNTFFIYSLWDKFKVLFLLSCVILIPIFS